MSLYIDFPPVKDVLVQGMDRIHLPKMYRIRQKFNPEKLENPSKYLQERLHADLSNQEDFRGKSICITAGSRGIPHAPELLKTIGDALKEWGAKPFLVPAMGSHGGATSQGQAELLAGYGITEESTGMPIRATMEAVKYAQLSNGTPLYCDKYAFESDGIVLFHKQKPHVDFRGPHESGLAKMMSIGLGKHVGASAFHMQGFPQFRQRIPEAAELFLQKLPVVFGVGVVENAYDEICAIRVAPPEQIMEMDRENLALAKERLAKFKFQDLDVLILDEIGKEISGYGHDTNITGRANGTDPAFQNILSCQRMVFLGITEKSHGNGTGIAEADVTTLRCMRSIDWAAVWTNLITAAEIQGCRMPMYANSDREAILLAIRGCRGIDYSRIRLARARNTLEIYEIEVSEALYEELKSRPDIETVEGPYAWSFDEAGYFLHPIK